MIASNNAMPDAYVAEFLDLAKSANIHFDLVDHRLTMRAANPNWRMWQTYRYLLDEIGTKRIAEYLGKQRRPTVDVVEQSAELRAGEMGPAALAD